MSSDPFHTLPSSQILESSKLPPLSSSATPPNSPFPIPQGPGIGVFPFPSRILFLCSMPVSSKSRKEGLPDTNAENVGTLPTIFAPPIPSKYLGSQRSLLRGNLSAGIFESLSVESPASKTGIWAVLPPPDPEPSPPPLYSPQVEAGRGWGTPGLAVGGRGDPAPAALDSKRLRRGE